MVYKKNGITYFFILQNDVSKFIPLIIFGALSLLAGLSTLILPETKGLTLPQTLKEAESIRRYMIFLFRIYNKYFNNILSKCRPIFLIFVLFLVGDGEGESNIT